MRFPIVPGRAPNAGTIWFIGVARNMPASGRARTAASTINGARQATATDRRPEAWLMRVEANGHGVVTDESLNSVERADEFLLMGLRLAEGIDPQRYAALAGRRAGSAPHRGAARRRRDRGRGRWPAARHAGRLSRARRGGRRSGGVKSFDVSETPC